MPCEVFPAVTPATCEGPIIKTELFVPRADFSRHYIQIVPAHRERPNRGAARKASNGLGAFVWCSPFARKQDCGPGHPEEAVGSQDIPAILDAYVGSPISPIHDAP